MVRMRELHSATTYVRIEQPNSTIGQYTIGGLINNGRISYMPLVRLNVQLDEKFTGKYSIFRGVFVNDTIRAAVYPALLIVRSAVYDALLGAYRVAISSGQIHADTPDHVEPLGMMKMLLSVVRTHIFNDIVQTFLASITYRLRNEVSREILYAWACDDVDVLGTANKLEAQGGILEVNLPVDDLNEVTAIRAKKLQWSAIAQLYGMPPGYDILRWFELAAVANALNDNDMEKDVINIDSFLLAMLSRVQSRPLLQGMPPDVFVYLTDRIVECLTFLFTRGSLKRKNWIVDTGVYKFLFPNLNEASYITKHKGYMDSFQDHQIANESSSGSEAWFMIPVSTADYNEQHADAGGPGVHLVEITRHAFVQPDDVILNVFSPQRLNKVDRHSSITYNRVEGIPWQEKYDQDSIYYTFTQLLPTIWSVQVPEETGNRRPVDFWPLCYSAYSSFDLITLDPPLPNALVDCVGLSHYNSGKLYCFQCQYNSSFNGSYRNADDKDKIEKVPLVSQLWQKIDTCCGWNQNTDYRGIFDELLKEPLAYFKSGTITGLKVPIPKFQNLDLVAKQNRRSIIAKESSPLGSSEIEQAEHEAALLQRGRKKTTSKKDEVKVVATAK